MSDITPENHAERAHSPLGASACNRWWNCPGSIQLSRQFKGRSSIFAREGTAAHELAQMCLQQQRDTYEFLGIQIEVEGHKITVDQEMVEAVQVYVEECRAQAEVGTAPPMIETRITLERLNPPDDMFGTADFMVQQGRTLCVLDLKYGKGVAVEAQDNPQLKYYALGAMYALPDDSGIHYIKVGIVQPRAPGTQIKYAEYDVLELLEWSVELIDKARVAISGDMTVNPGSWCRFCPASGVCPAQADKALKAAQDAFSADVAAKEILKLPEISIFTPEELSMLLHNAEQLESWIQAARAAARAMLEVDPDAVPGWTMGPTKGTRKWIDANKSAEIMTKRGFSDDDIWKKELISVAQAEEKVGRRLKEDGEAKTVKEGKSMAKSLFSDNVIQESAGVKLTPVGGQSSAVPTQSANLFG